MKTNGPHCKTRRVIYLSLALSSTAEIALLSVTSLRFAVNGVFASAFVTAVLYATYLHTEECRRRHIQLPEPKPYYTGLYLLTASVMSLSFASLCCVKESFASYTALRTYKGWELVRLYGNVCFLAAFCVLLILTLLVVEQDLAEQNVLRREHEQMEMSDLLRGSDGYTDHEAYTDSNVLYTGIQQMV